MAKLHSERFSSPASSSCLHMGASKASSRVSTTMSTGSHYCGFLINCSCGTDLPAPHCSTDNIVSHFSTAEA